MNHPRLFRYTVRRDTGVIWDQGSLCVPDFILS